jgi:glycerol-3-phosphate O-acyltransferase/dihydroxyacetone phosphate acyltransferase
LGEALVRLYYPARSVDSGERIPRGKPLVFVLNHPNGLLDPIVLRVASGRPSRFLAKSTLFGNPLGRLAMSAFGSIPVYRAHESGARSGDASRNDVSFARCRAELAAGSVLALFPEGVSHSDPEMRPLKIGAARIALSGRAHRARGSWGAGE